MRQAKPPRASTTSSHPVAADAARPLAGRVAVVAGATRGAGRGIARALGEAGATVYCTGRSTRGAKSHYGRPETIDETAEMIQASGGSAIAVRVDHANEEAVKAFFARIDADEGRLDILANSVAGEDPMLGGWTSFWQTDLTHAAEALDRALLSHLVTAKYAAPLMIRRKRGLIVEVTEGDLLYAGGNVLHDLAKSGRKGLVVRLSEELRTHKVAVVALTPGFLRTETMLEAFGVTESTWRDGGKKDGNFLVSETPLFIGRAVAALAADPKVLARSGDILSSWELAREYGFTDADGSRPDWGEHGRKIIPAMKWWLDATRRHQQWLERLAQRAKQYAEA